MLYWDHNAGAPLLPEIARHLSTAFAHLGNIVARTGRTIRLINESIDSDHEADALTSREYRDHWSAPKG